MWTRLFEMLKPRPAANRAASGLQATSTIMNGRSVARWPLLSRVDLSAVRKLDLTDCADLRELPPNLHVRRLNLSGCRKLRELPPGLRCYMLELRETPLRTLPSDVVVEFRLDLSNCTNLETLPAGLKVGTLHLRGCVSLQTLPEGLDVCFLDISGCTGLSEWPRHARVHIGRFSARGCTQLTSLPAWLTSLSQLDVSDCSNLTALPEGLRLTSWLDLAGTGLRSLPTSLEGVELRWRGVPIDARIAFRPETITYPEVMRTSNAELRRVLLERMGYENFLRQAKAETLDEDRDAGGDRRLLRVPLVGDEPLVVLAVFCPSTGRQYVLRVPPTVETCRKAAAWLAGIENEKEYRLIEET